MQHTFDPMIAAFLVDASTKKYSLPRVAERYLEIAPEAVEVMSLGQKAYLVAQLEETLTKRLKQDELMLLFTDVEMPLAHVLADVEAAGVTVDTAALKELSQKFEHEIHILEKDIYTLAGKTFNINSPKQLQQILFEKMQLGSGARTKTGLSTNVKVLTELVGVHPIAEKIIQYRQYSKLKNTYVDALPELVHPVTHKIHTTFEQTIAATGRLSSIDPNLQNIPIRTEEGRSIRKAFIAEENHVLLAADYSQIELRLMAHFSEDENLMHAFEGEGNKDIHTHTASLIFHKPEAEISSTERRYAKTVNFGVIYGMGPFRLSQELKISRKEAQNFIDQYFATYSKVKGFMDGLVEEAKTTGFLTTVLGRRRYFKELNSQNRVVAEAAKREAINYPLQGSAADIIKVAMINIHKVFAEKKLALKMILQVHDELVFSVAKDESEKVAHIVKTEMEQAISLRVPVKVDIGFGKSWYEAH